MLRSRGFVRVRSGAFALLALVVCAAVGRATTTSEGVLLPGERLDDVLSSLGENKTVSIAVLAGSQLSVTCAKKGRSRIEPRLSALHPDGRPALLDGYVKLGGGSARLKRLPISTTGIVRLDVATPPAAGGAYRLSTKMTGVPTSWKHAGAVDESGSDASFAFDALPLSTLKLVVKSSGKPKWSPGVRIETPSGGFLDAIVPAGQAGAAKLTQVVLPELGRYVVHVDGGPGAYKLAAKVKAPRPGREIGYGDVASAPQIDGVSPSAVANDGLRVLTLDGFAFDFRHGVSLRQNGQLIVADSLEGYTSSEATVRLDLRGVAPGAYDVFATAAAGTSVDTGFDVTVTNAPPAIGITVPGDIPMASSSVVEVQGSGMDPGTTISAKLDADGSDIPVTLIDHRTHDRAKIRLGLLPYQVGTVTLTAVEPGGASGTRPAVLDVLGPRRAPASLGTVASPNPSNPQFQYPTSVAYSPSRKSVVAASLSTTSRIEFHHLDHATGAVIRQLTPPQAPGTTNLGWSHAAWNETDDRWGLVWSDHSGGTTRVHFSLHEGDDLANQVVQNELVTFASSVQGVGRVHLVANPDDGGWLATWSEHRNNRATLVVQPIESDGSFSAAQRREILQHDSGYIWQPCLERQSDDRYLLVYIGATDNEFYFALRSVVVDGRGRTASGGVLAAWSADWWNVSEPVIGVRPSDGRAVLVFSWESQDGEEHPATQPFDVNGNPTHAPRTLDQFGELPEGRAHGVVWNPARAEFVLSATRFDTADRIVVRRLDEDGWMKSAPDPLEIEGLWGFLYSGPDDGSLGMVWLHSSADRAAFDWDSDTFHLLAAPLR